MLSLHLTGEKSGEVGRSRGGGGIGWSGQGIAERLQIQINILPLLVVLEGYVDHGVPVNITLRDSSVLPGLRLVCVCL